MRDKIIPVIGFGVGLLFLLFALIAYIAAFRWGGLGRDGAATGYAATGIFFTISGGGGIVAIWNHYFRVLKRAER